MDFELETRGIKREYHIHAVQLAAHRQVIDQILTEIAGLGLICRQDRFEIPDLTDALARAKSTEDLRAQIMHLQAEVSNIHTQIREGGKKAKDNTSDCKLNYLGEVQKAHGIGIDGVVCRIRSLEKHFDALWKYSAKMSRP